MKDVGTTPQTADPARDLVERLIVRRQWDPDLAYLFGQGSETYEHLRRAVQQVRGCSATEAADLLRLREKERNARMPELQRRVDRLERLLDEHHPEWRDEEESRV